MRVSDKDCESGEVVHVEVMVRKINAENKLSHWGLDGLLRVLFNTNPQLHLLFVENVS